jgi:hypothetical protein
MALRNNWTGDVYFKWRWDQADMKLVPRDEYQKEKYKEYYLENKDKLAEEFNEKMKIYVSEMKKGNNPEFIHDYTLIKDKHTVDF